MTGKDIISYVHLWTTERDSWALVEVPGAEFPVIYNPTNKNILIIEDDDCLAQVIEMMKASGVQVLDGFPSREG